MTFKEVVGWTKPKISPRNTNPKNVGNHCYVWFRFFDQDKKKWSHPIKRRPHLEHPYSKIDHYLNLRALIKAIEYKLEIERWNPVTNTYPEFKWEELEIDQQLLYIKQFDFGKAVDFALEKKKPDLRKKTIHDYNCKIKYLKQAATTLQLLHKPMGDFKLPHYRALLEQVRKERNLTASGYNIYRSFLSALVSEMIQWEILEANMVFYVKCKPEEKRFCHRPPTRDEQSIIMKRIITDHPNYYRFLSVLYGCTLRPVEITRLQIKNLHPKEGIFRLPAHYAKTKTERDIIIPDWVMDILMKMNLQNYPPDYFIFSKNFLPGEKQLPINYTHGLWKKIVKDGLGMNVNLYGLKKLAGDDMVRIQRNDHADNLLELARQQMGHTTTRQTETYVTEHREVLKELIKKKMPVL